MTQPEALSRLLRLAADGDAAALRELARELKRASYAEEQAPQ